MRDCCKEKERAEEEGKEHRRFPISYQAVDIALYYRFSSFVVVTMGQKATDPSEFFRFPGGFVDPKDNSLEAAAIRETAEEVNCIIPLSDLDKVKYLNSFRSKDKRFQNSEDKLMTALFAYDLIGISSQEFKPGDDLAVIKKVTFYSSFKVFQEKTLPIINPNHRDMALYLWSFLFKNQ